MTKKITKADQYKQERTAILAKERLQAEKLSKLTAAEQTELDDTGVIFGTIERVCQIALITKADLARSLKVKPQQITNYINLERMAEYNPKGRAIRIVAPEKVVNQGVV